MIIEKIIKSTTNNLGYIRIKKHLINKEIDIIINNKLIKTIKTTQNKIYLKKEHIGEKAILNYN